MTRRGQSTRRRFGAAGDGPVGVSFGFGATNFDDCPVTRRTGRVGWRETDTTTASATFF